MVAVEEKSVPLEVNLQTAWGSVEVKPQVFVVMEGNDDTMILGRVPLGMLGIGPNAEFDRIARGPQGGWFGLYERYVSRRNSAV